MAVHYTSTYMQQAPTDMLSAPKLKFCVIRMLRQVHQMKQLLIAMHWLVLALSTEASELAGKVVSVSDGDTLRVLVDDQQIKIRLGGIDAPESDQPFGQASKRYLAEAVGGQTVVVEFEKKDRYGRVIGKVLLDGADMNLRQVQAGYAWWYEYYKLDQSETDQQAYSAAEQQARGSRVGLWSDRHRSILTTGGRVNVTYLKSMRASPFSAAISNTASRCRVAPRRSFTCLAAV